MEVLTKGDLGARLRELRHRRKLTQEAMAELADISADTIRRLEQGRYSPSFDTMVKLAKGLNIPMMGLLTDDYTEEDDLAVLIRALPSPHKELAVAMLGTLHVQAVMQ